MGRHSLADQRKPEILEHFYQVLIKEGLQGASIAKIAKHMGVNPSLLTHYFKSKEEMVIELLELFFARYNDAFIIKIQKIHDPEKRFDTLLDTFFGVEWDDLMDTSAFYACFYIGFRNKRAAQSIKLAFSRLKEFVCQELELAVKAGILKEIDVEMTADLIISIQEGISFYKCASGDNERTKIMDRFLVAKAKKMLKKVP